MNPDIILNVVKNLKESKFQPTSFNDFRSIMFVINQLNIKKEYAPQFLREVNFFCSILHYKKGVIYQQLNIKYLKIYQFVAALVLRHSMFATSLTRFAFRTPNDKS